MTAFDAALKEYIAGQNAVADQAAAHLNLAVVYTNLAQGHYGDPGRANPQYLAKAEEEYRTAIRIEAEFVPARINLAMLCDSLGRKDEAEALFREIIVLDPEMAEAHYSLGLLIAENADRMEEATESLGRAAELSPENARIHYNYGLALQKLERWSEAEEALKESLRISGPSADSLSTLHALAILHAQQKRWDQAIKCYEKLAQMQPNNPQWQQSLQALRRQSAGE
jgi:tetratricopeptide (TPR) repeat protein